MEERICKTCGVLKSLVEYQKIRKGKDYCKRICRQCSNEKVRMNKQFYTTCIRCKESKKATKGKYCKECYTEYMIEYNKKCYDKCMSEGNKICKTCEVSKPLDDYRRVKNNKEYFYPHCRSCYNARQKSLRPTYSICSMCKEEKEPSKGMYCRRCSQSYMRKWNQHEREFKASIPDDYQEQIKLFTKKIIDNGLRVDLWDINDIITYYSYVTTRIHEYDVYKIGAQINMMFEKLIKVSR